MLPFRPKGEISCARNHWVTPNYWVDTSDHVSGHKADQGTPKAIWFILDPPEPALITRPGAIFRFGYVSRKARIPLVSWLERWDLHFISMGKRVPSRSKSKSTSPPPDVRQWYMFGETSKVMNWRRISLTTQDSKIDPRSGLTERLSGDEIRCKEQRRPESTKCPFRFPEIRLRAFPWKGGSSNHWNVPVRRSSHLRAVAGEIPASLPNWDELISWAVRAAVIAKKRPKSERSLMSPMIRISRST